MKIGEIISNLRKDRKWSQTDLAEKTGISQVMVGKYERGDAAPSIDVAKNIADRSPRRPSGEQIKQRWM
ncbi:MAG: helix-turn-helix transcriptional regulator [Crocinitomicaceae bacterium]|nr:helix-turn-helix transcriptional regulator [Crocinitomicaceae bacterium]